MNYPYRNVFVDIKKFVESREKGKEKRDKALVQTQYLPNYRIGRKAA